VPASSPLQYPGVAENAFYSEGVLVGYRHYDTRGITPLFPFGYGLSYTSFALRNLKVVPGALPGYATVEADVQNTGARPGSEVVQLYVGDPGTAVPEPPRQLQGFAKLALQPGETGHVVMPLTPRAFAYWDATHHTWAVPPGCYGIMLGTSSREIREQTTLGLGGAPCGGASASEAQPAAPLEGVTPGVSSLPTTSTSRTPAAPWALLPVIIVAFARITRRRTRGEARPGR
jgi:beta-glucosidase